MQRLYLQFYLTILVVLAVFVGAAALLWRLADDDARTPQYFEIAAELTGALLPDADAPAREQQAAVESLYRKLRFDIALYRPNGTMIAMAGKPPPRFDHNRARQGWRRGPGGPSFTLQLPDGRWLVARQVRDRPISPTFWITAFLALVALAVAVAIDQSRIDQRADPFLEEERVAPGPLQDLLLGRTGQAHDGEQ